MGVQICFLKGTSQVFQDIPINDREGWKSPHCSRRAARSLRLQQRLCLWMVRALNQSLPTNNPYVLVMATNPDPEQIMSFFDSDSSVGTSDPNRPIFVDLLEPERRVPRTSLEQLEVSARSPLNGFWQSLEM